MSSVYANMRTIIHKGDGLVQTAPVPDVCKTPSPGGPVPIPYPNIAKDSDLAKGTKKVKIKGKSVALKTSNLSTSTGDEAGTAGGGIVSSKTKGKLTWTVASVDVKFEGKGVVRFLDVTMHNGNMGNTAGADQGGAGAGGEEEPTVGHRKGARKSKKDKHQKRRPGSMKDKRRKKRGWKPKKFGGKRGQR